MPEEKVKTAHSAWLVDLDGTLYRSVPVRIAMTLELSVLGWGEVRVIRCFRQEHEKLRHEQLGEETDPYLLQLTRTAGACGLSLQHVRSVVEEWMFRRPAKWMRFFRRRSLIKNMRQFRSIGGRIAIVSDYPARTKLQKLNVVDLTDAVVANGEGVSAGTLKPSPDGYRKAAMALGVAPSSCLVIGDRADLDGVAATAAGMQFRKV